MTVTEREKINEAKDDLMSYAVFAENERTYLHHVLMHRDKADKIAKGLAGEQDKAGLDSIARVAEKFDEQAKCCSRRVCDMMDILGSIKNPKYVRVLRIRYIDWVGKSDKPPEWEYIAWKMHYDDGYVKELHHRALLEYAKRKTDFYSQTT